MKTGQNPSNTLPAWLKANLGRTSLAPLTGTDARALRAAVLIVELWNQCDAHYEADCYAAFAAVVKQMQSKCRELAFHAIAHVSDWHVRRTFWERTGLPMDFAPRRCAYEPR